MTIELGELRARMTADSQGLKAEIRDFKKDLSDLGEQGKKTAANLNEIDSNIGNTRADAVMRLAKTLDNLTDRIDIQKNKLTELRQSFETAFDETKKGKIHEQILRTEASILRMEQTFNSTAKKLQELDEGLEGVGHEAKQVEVSFNGLNSTLRQLGLSSDQIKKINQELKDTNPQIVEQQLKQVESQLNAMGIDGQQALSLIKQEIKQIGQGSVQASTEMNMLDNALKEIGLNADQIKIIKKHLDEADPTKLDHQLDEVSAALKKLGVDSKQIEKITNELRESEQEAQKTKQGISGIASGLASLGAGAATVKLVNVMKSLAGETNQLANSYRGLSIVSEKFNVDSEASVDLAEKLADRWGLNKGTLADTVKTYLTMNLTLEETEKLITATADAAAYNRQAHLSWDQAIKQVAEGIKAGNSNLTDAAGITTNLSVMYDRYAKSIGTTAAKLTEAQKVQAAYNGMMQEASIFAGNADSAMTGYTGTQATFNQTLEMARVELGESFLPVIQEVMEDIIPLVKGFTQWTSENKELVAGLATGTVTILGLVTAMTAAAAAARMLGISLAGLQSSAGILGVISLAIGLVVGGLTTLAVENREVAAAVKEHDEAQQALNRTLRDAPYGRTVDEIKEMKNTLEELTPLLEEQAVIQERLNEIQNSRNLGEYDYAQAAALNAEAGELALRLNEIREQVYKMGFDTFDEATEKVREMKDAVDESIPALAAMEREQLANVAVQVKHIDSVNKLKKEYDDLNSKEKLSEEQKQRLSEVVKALTKEYPGLISNLDEENRWHITNYDTLKDLIQAERDSVSESAKSSKNRIENWRRETEAKLKLARKQLEALMSVESVSASNPNIPDAVATYVDKIAEGTGKSLQKNVNQYQLQINELDQDLQNITAGAFDKFLPVTDTGADDSKKKSKSKTSKTRTAADLRKDAYDAAIATVQYQAEMYDWTADEQIKAYEKVRKQHQKHLKESLEDERQMNLQLKRLQEDSVRSRYDFSAEWIGREERRMEESGKTEIEIAQMKIDAWTRVRDRYAKDSEFYKDADEKLFQLRKELISATEKAMKELYSSTSDFLKYEERRLEEAGASETEIAQMKLELWTRIRDSYAEDSEYYKQADEQVYQAKKNLISQIQKDSEAARKVEKQSISDAKKEELGAIAERKKAYTDDIDERIADIDRLIKAEERLNTEQDYASQLAEKKARQALLENAVSPEGRKEYADITKEIERMELEHSRDIRKQNLEDQKEALRDEKSERERAFDKEKEDAEKHYDALTDALENFQDDVKLMEAGLQDYRVGANQTANTQILSDLDSFVSAYNSKLASLTSASGPSQQANDLQEYNSNKDAWDEAKARGDQDEMARLTARNNEIRRKYGIEKDTGKLDNLPSYDVGGVIPGPIGVPVPIVAHGGEIYLNPEQQANLFRMLDSPKPTSGVGQAPVQPQQIIHNTFDMSVGLVTIEDQPDAEIMYTERERAARRLATTGGGK